MKRCARCKEEKEFSQFYKNSSKKDGLQTRCKVCTKKYEKNNREKILARKRKYHEKNREKIRATQRKYRENNKEKIRVAHRKYRKLKWATCPMFKMVNGLRGRLRTALCGKCKSARTMALLACTVEQLKKSLENQFEEGMTWENMGTAWHVDHMIPCSLFDFSSNAQQHRCFHYTNLQPLFASDNRSKGNKNIYGPYMKWEGDQWHIKINGEFMSRSRQVEERIPTQYFYPIKWMLSKAT